jgi:hypothetical protein
VRILVVTLACLVSSGLPTGTVAEEVQACSRVSTEADSCRPGPTKDEVARLRAFADEHRPPGRDATEVTKNPRAIRLDRDSTGVERQLYLIRQRLNEESR